MRIEMLGKKVYFSLIPLMIIWLFCSHAWCKDPSCLGFPQKGVEELTLYFRKISGNRYLDTSPGASTVNENVYHALFVWGGYHAEQVFVLSSLGLHLHFDATIFSSDAISKIKIRILRNGDVVYTTDVYELPAGHSGELQLDILAEVDVYPSITFNQGDELGFYFYQIENLSPCRFRYNDATCRNDSYLTVELQKPDYPMIELSPVDFDLALEQGVALDTTLEISNVGGHVMYYNLSLPQGLNTFRYDDNTPARWWSLSDQNDGDLFNVRFSPAQTCILKSARLLLSEEGSSGSPDIMVYVWDDSEGFPGAKVDSLLVPYESLSFSPYWQVVDFTDREIVFQANQDFHIGYALTNHSPGDSLALYSDDGLPVGNQRRSSGLWGEYWRTMYQRYEVDFNFMIRVEGHYGDKPEWITFGSYPGVLNPEDVQQIGLQVDASGLSDGVYQSSVVIATSCPDRSVLVPITLRVGQTPVEGGEVEPPLPRSLLAVNYPNPFNASTRIAYQVGSPGPGYDFQRVRLIVYNLLGQRVRTLVDEAQDPGLHSVRWDGRDEGGVEVASGVYVYRLEVGNFQQMRKMVLLR